MTDSTLPNWIASHRSEYFGSNPRWSISEGCFILHFVSLPFVDYSAHLANRGHKSDRKIVTFTCAWYRQPWVAASRSFSTRYFSTPDTKWRNTCLMEFRDFSWYRYNSGTTLHSVKCCYLNVYVIRPTKKQKAVISNKNIGGGAVGQTVEHLAFYVPCPTNTVQNSK